MFSSNFKSENSANIQIDESKDDKIVQYWKTHNTLDEIDYWSSEVRKNHQKLMEVPDELLTTDPKCFPYQMHVIEKKCKEWGSDFNQNDHTLPYLFVQSLIFGKPDRININDANLILELPKKYSLRPILQGTDDALFNRNKPFLMKMLQSFHENKREDETGEVFRLFTRLMFQNIPGLSYDKEISIAILKVLKPDQAFAFALLRLHPFDKEELKIFITKKPSAGQNLLNYYRAGNIPRNKQLETYDMISDINFLAYVHIPELDYKKDPQRLYAVCNQLSVAEQSKFYNEAKENDPVFSNCILQVNFQMKMLKRSNHLDLWFKFK